MVAELKNCKNINEPVKHILDDINRIVNLKTIAGLGGKKKIAYAAIVQYGFGFFQRAAALSGNDKGLVRLFTASAAVSRYALDELGKTDDISEWADIVENMFRKSTKLMNFYRRMHPVECQGEF